LLINRDLDIEQPLPTENHTKYSAGGEKVRTWHRIIIGDCRKMREIPDCSVHLAVTSPPYFNSPFDYPGLYDEYSVFLDTMRTVTRELRRVLAPGRVTCFVTQDVRVDGRLYPVTSDIARIMIEEGFNYRDRIIWRKPEGYVRISHRSGVLIRNPYPMYYYPDNVFEEILIMQKGIYDYPKREQERELSKIDLRKFNAKKWYLSVWDITNVLPRNDRLEQGIAAFPEEIPRRLIELFTYVGETVLDPFLGSGTTMKVAIELRRNSYGYEIDPELKPLILEKIGCCTEKNHDVNVVVRKDATPLKSVLQEKVHNRENTKKKHTRALESSSGT
jgi:DNA modification methylase